MTRLTSAHSEMRILRWRRVARYLEGARGAGLRWCRFFRQFYGLSGRRHFNAPFVSTLTCCVALLLLICWRTSAAITFVQLTDPRLFSGVQENDQALVACIQKINARNRLMHFSFVVLTGDIGIEDLVSTRNRETGRRELKSEACRDRDLKNGAERFAAIIADSEVKKWLFVPGSNDLVDEDPRTIEYYNRFITDVGEALSNRGCGTDAVNLINVETRNYVIDRHCAFIGFNNSSSKGNNLAENAAGWKDAQLNEIKKVDQSIREIAAKNEAQLVYIFYHIPEVDRSGCDPGASRWSKEPFAL